MTEAQTFTVATGTMYWIVFSAVTTGYWLTRTIDYYRNREVED